MEFKTDSKTIEKKCYSKQNFQLPQLEHQSIGGLCRRRTSAEMISEAKIYLNDASSSTKNTIPNQAASVVGVRVVRTRRPITPRESGRVLYGKVILPGRPPSAFSLRYLQSVDSRGSTPKTSPLEPLQTTEVSNSNLSTLTHKCLRKDNACYGGNEHNNTTSSRRSQSLESCFECYENKNISSNALTAKLNASLQMQTKSQLVRKLPALEVKDSIKYREERAKTANNEKDGDSLNITELPSKDSCSINLLTTRKILSKNNDLLGQSSTEKLIDMLKEHSGLKECTEETACHINSILTELYNRVRKNEKHFKKGFILGGIYGLVEASSAKILHSVARVVLALRVSGSNLTGACKLIFKVARNEQNDHLFYESNLLELLIDGLGRASPLEDPEACIYGYGSIRFLTCSTVQERAELATTKDFNRNWSEQFELPRKPNTAPNLGENQNLISERHQKSFAKKLSRQDALVVRLSQHGAVQLMVLHLQILNEAGASQRLSGPPLHTLYQLSAALRALADVRQTSFSFERLENANQILKATNIQLELACPHLIRAAEITIGEIDVQANIVRTLSALSEDSNCCHILTNFAGRIGMLLGPCCSNFKSNRNDKLLSLVSRLGYILGNIMAKYDNARLQFYHNDVAIEYLINVLEIYSLEPLTLHNSLGDSVVDVLVKMVRVIANMSVNSEVGLGLGSTPKLGSILMTLLKTSQQIKGIKMKQELQELTHATLGALHNLCFYQESGTVVSDFSESRGSLRSILPEFATLLSSLLKTLREETMDTEITRVLGNLTRNEKARKSFCKNHGLKLVVEILKHSTKSPSYDLKACTIGILVNLLGDVENRLPLIQLKGPEILLELLREALQHADFFLATVISQAFWNLFIDATYIEDVCPETTLDELSDILAEYIDEDKMLRNFSNKLIPELWEDFAIVSTDLLERLQLNYNQQSDSIESLETNDFDNDKNDLNIEGL